MEHSSEEPGTLFLVSKSGVKFELKYSAARLSQTVKDAQKGEGEDDFTPQDVEFERIDAGCLKNVVEFLKHYEEEPMNGIVTPLKENSFDSVVNQEWYRNFLNNVDQPMLFELVTAANYLAIQPLIDLTILKVSCLFMGKSPEEIRCLLNIPPMTAEEMSKARRDHRWLFDD